MKMRINKNIIVIPVVLILILLSAISRQPTGGSSEHYTILSGNSGGTYYYIGAGQASILSDYTNLSVSTQSTSGSPVDNLTLVSQDVRNLGLVTVDGYCFGQEGAADRGFRNPLSNTQVLQVGHAAYLYAITLKSSHITEFSQLSGKTIGIPPAGSSTYYMTLAILEEYGCTAENTTLIPLAASEQADALKDGGIDAAFLAGGLSQATVMDLDYSNDICFLSIDPVIQERVDQKYPFWHSSVIPKGTYRGQTKEVHCLTAHTLLVCNSLLETDAAYTITKALNEHTGELGAIHTSGYQWSLQTTQPYLDDPMLRFHPGARKYYQEALK